MFIQRHNLGLVDRRSLKQQAQPMYRFVAPGISPQYLLHSKYSGWMLFLG